jgi:hypothetical protein
MTETGLIFLTILLSVGLTLAVNGFFVMSLRRTVQHSNWGTSDAVTTLQQTVTRYKEVAEGALAALTTRCEQTDDEAEKLDQTNADMARALQSFTEVFNTHLTRTDARADLVNGLQEEVRYLRRVAFADNEYVKAVQDPAAQGAVAAQVRRETEPPPVAGRPPMRTFRHRMEEELPPPRARTRVPIEVAGLAGGGYDADDIAKPTERPWGAEPGKPPAAAADAPQPPTAE